MRNKVFDEIFDKIIKQYLNTIFGLRLSESGTVKRNRQMDQDFIDSNKNTLSLFMTGKNGKPTESIRFYSVKYNQISTYK